ETPSRRRAFRASRASSRARARAIAAGGFDSLGPCLISNHWPNIFLARTALPQIVPKQESPLKSRDAMNDEAAGRSVRALAGSGSGWGLEWHMACSCEA